MKHIRKATDRLARQLKAIDKDIFRDSLRMMLAAYGVTTAAIPQLPRMWSVSDEEYFSRAGGRIYASAEQHMPTFYIRNVLCRARKVPLELFAAHIYSHEIFHYLGRRTVSRSRFVNDAGSDESFVLERVIFGFQLQTMISNEAWKAEQCLQCGFHYFNEGVTELLAREFFAHWWIQRGRLRNVSEAQRQEYLADLENSKGFYPVSVRFVQALLTRFALTSEEMPQTVLRWLVQAYVAGTDLRTDATWLNYVKRAGLPDSFTEQLERATENQLETLLQDGLVRKLKLNPVFGHAFADIVVI